MKLKLLSFLFLMAHQVYASERDLQITFSAAVKHSHLEEVKHILNGNPQLKIESRDLERTSQWNVERSKSSTICYGLMTTSATFLTLVSFAANDPGAAFGLITLPIAGLLASKTLFHGVDWYRSHKIQELITNHKKKKITVV